MRGVWNLTAPPIDPADPAYYKACASVTAAGNVEQGAGCSVARVGVGRYRVTFYSPHSTATYPVLATMQSLPQNDDYQWGYLNRTVNGFTLEIREQDNGSSPGDLRDSGFSIYVPIL